jgi:predicted PhzF superfamily epimerase YddE/YHI9
MLPPSVEHRLLFRQGDSLNAPSDIYVHLKVLEEKIEKVECGGEVVVDKKRDLAVPSEKNKLIDLG